MRKPFFLGFISIALAVTASAHQRAAASTSAPSVAMHSMPLASAGTVHSAPIHAVVPAHAATHSSGSSAAPAAPHRRALSTSANTHHRVGSPGEPVCNQHYSYPIQGLSACPQPGGVLPFYGGAYYVAVPYYVDSTPQDQAQTQEQEDVQHVASNAQQDGNSEQAEQASATNEPSRSASRILNDSLAEFVFVQRDGSKLYAVAYSFLNDKLQYVTKEGVRHSVGVDLLDLDSTQKFNEQLGNTINLPNLPAGGVALNVSPAPLR
jgi:hypothetical protein